MWFGWRLTKKQLTGQIIYGQSSGKNGQQRKLKEKHKCSHEKPQVDNARKWRGISFIDFEDKEFKETIKNARKKLETPMAPAMPCKISKKELWDWVKNPMLSNQNLRVFWKPVNLQGRG